MTSKPSPRVLLLDGNYSHSVSVARELEECLGATVIAACDSPSAFAARSRHVSETVRVPSADSNGYGEALEEIITAARPDVVVPVGYRSTSAMVDLASSGLAVPVAAPGAKDFGFAEDKLATYQLAAVLGVRHPRDFTASVAPLGKTDELPVPFIAKARYERGGSTVHVIRSRAEFDAHLADKGDEEFIYQEFVDTPPITYAHCGVFENGRPLAEFQHVELRSVPRHGGSGTRLASIRDSELATEARKLLRAAEWTGLAQVEFKRDRDGRLVIMEINPKVWASYALASRSRAPLISGAVRQALSLPSVFVPEYRSGVRMVFPVREALHVLRNREFAEVPKALAAMAWPPSHVDVEVGDLAAYVPIKQKSRA